VETVSVDVTEPFGGSETLVAPSDTRGPLGETVAVSMTVFVNPLTLVRVIVADPDEPWATVTVVGFDVAVKSGVPLVLDWTTKVPIICCKCIEQ
jgi:hypothetical protein